MKTEWKPPPEKPGRSNLDLTGKIGVLGVYKPVAPTSPVTMSFPSGEKANALRVFLRNSRFSLKTGLVQREN